MVPWHLRCLEWTKMDQDIDPSATRVFVGRRSAHTGIELIVLMRFIFWVNWSTPVQGYWFDSSERCTRDPCVDNDRSTSLNLCCKPSEPCSSLTCPHGTLAALRWKMTELNTPSIIIHLHPSFVQYGRLQFGTSLLIHCSFPARFSLLFWFCDESCFQKRKLHFAQSCQNQAEVLRSSLQDELSFIDLCAVSVYLCCWLDD